MKLSLDFSSSPAISAWVAKQADAQAAVLAVVEAYVQANDNPVGDATAALKQKVLELPHDLRFEISQVIGPVVWNRLDRADRVKFGKHVKANAAQFGIEYVERSPSNHSIYKRIAKQ